MTSISRREGLIGLALSIILAIFTCSASDRIFNRQERRAEAVEMEFAILHGQPFHESGNLSYKPAFQNRILFPIVLKVSSGIGLFSVAGWYALCRLCSAIMLFLTFWYVLMQETRATPKLASVGLLLLAYCLVFTFNLPLVVTSDFPDGMFTALFITASLQRKRWILFALSILAAANRESSVFAGVIWFVLYGIGWNLRTSMIEAAYAAFVSVCSYGAVLLLRYELGGTKAIASSTQLLTVRTNLYLFKIFLENPLAPFSWLSLNICMITPCILWIISNRKFLTIVHKRLIAAAILITMASLIFGIASEPRIFIPSIVVLIFVAVWAEVKSWSQTEASLV